MSQALRDRAAIVGIGASRFGRHLPESQLALAATAFRAALDDAGLERGDIDGLSIHIGWPLGVDYDQVAQVFGLEIGFVNQAWTHGRFVTGSLQTAAMAVACGMARVVACVNVLSFTRERDILGGPHDFEGYRETGGTHAETPHYGADRAGRRRGTRHAALHGALRHEQRGTGRGAGVAPRPRQAQPARGDAGAHERRRPPGLAHGGGPRSGSSTAAS